MAVTQLARHIGRLSKKQPGTPKDIELWAYAHLNLRVGIESIRKALNGDIDPSQCAMELLIALAGYYGVEPAALGHIAESRLSAVIAYASTAPTPPNGGPGQVIDASGWFSGSADLDLVAA